MSGDQGKPAAMANDRPPARFVSGSILKHILVMTGTSAIGLMAVFISELLSVLFLGLLRQTEILAAIGYAATIMFFSTSVGIGFSIATTALVAPAVGRGERDATRRLATNAHVFAACSGALLAALLWPFLGDLLSTMGARGDAKAMALDYLQIVMATLPLTCLGMTSIAVLRSVGDAERAMNVTLASAAVSVALEPFFIFMLKLGMHGSALAILCARLSFAAVGLIGAFAIHRLFARPSTTSLSGDLPAFASVAVPAVLTNIATPVANVYTTTVVAQFGDAAMAAWAVMARIHPVAFCSVFCLSGAVGPIFGQNLGAAAYGRVRATLDEALKANAVFCVAACLALAAVADDLPRWFHLSGQAADLVRFSCLWVSPLFFFLGLLFIANAAFNTLGYPGYATALNWGRATLGTVPLVTLASRWYGAEGVFVASVAGAVLIGGIAVWLSYRVLPRA